jgi:hypothetical protein
LGFKNELEKDNKANGVYLKMGGSPLNCPSDFNQIKETYYKYIYLSILFIYLTLYLNLYGRCNKMQRKGAVLVVCMMTDDISYGRAIYLSIYLSNI